MATERQKAHALIGHYLRRYNKVFGANPPGFNRHALAHGFTGLMLDYPHHAEQIIDYYVENYTDPNPVWLTYNYDKIMIQIQEAKADAEDREKIRRLTQERMKNVINSRQSDQGGNSE